MTLACKVNCDTASRHASISLMGPVRAHGRHAKERVPQRIEPPTSLTDARHGSSFGPGQSRRVKILLTSVLRSSGVSSGSGQGRRSEGRDCAQAGIAGDKVSFGVALCLCLSLSEVRATTHRRRFR